MTEVLDDTPIEKAQFVYRRTFMAMEHNYLCAVCKEHSAVQECHTGILQPCWECQKQWKIRRVTWLDRLLRRS